MAEIPLSDEEVGRRIKAARALRGWDNAEKFAAWLNEKRYDIAATAFYAYERGQRTLGKGDRLQLMDALNMPEDWFTAPEEDLFAQRVGPPPSVEELMARIQEVRDAVSEMSSKLTRDMRDLETSTANETQP